MKQFYFLCFLAGLSVIGFLATDMYLPAFEMMRIDLQTESSLIGASLTIYLGGFALAQLFWGPITDNWGNRKTLLAGLSLFILASLAIFLSHDIVVLIVMRLIQSFGACAAAVCWQALVIDKYEKKEADHVFATIMPLVALSPALAPIIGAFIAVHFGWRFIFVFIALAALFLLVYAYSLDDRKKKKFDELQSSLSYWNFFKKKHYIGYVLVYACCSAGFFAWLTGAPFFLSDLGYSESQIGLSFVPQTITFILGGYGYRMIANKILGVKLLPYLLLLYALSILVILYLAIWTVPNLMLLLIPFSLMAFTNGATYPIVVSEALKPFKDNSGKAAALQNTLQMGICFFASAGVSAWSRQALIATSLTMSMTILFAGVGFVLTLKTKS